MLKALINSLSDVPQELQQYYKEVGDGTFVLDTDDGSFRAKITDFRGNNIKLKQANEEALEKLASYEGIDPDKYAEALEARKELAALQDKKLLEEGDVESLLERRTQTMRDDFASQTEALTKARDAASAKSEAYYAELSSLKIDSAVTSAVLAAGTPAKGADLDIRNRARAEFSLDDQGQLVSKNYDAEGAAYTPETWTAHLIQSAPYLFDANGGGGAGGGADVTDAGSTVIGSNDIGNNLEAVAKGEAVVR